MTDIRFYHLQKQSLDQALPLILEKAYQTNKNIIVRMGDDKEVARMNDVLWTYKADSFLPHGTKKEGNAPHQPIWITDKDDNPNDAKILVLTQGVQEDDVSAYDLCCEMLDGHDDKAIAAARKRWKDYQENGHEVTYWYQSESGKWEKKA